MRSGRQVMVLHTLVGIRHLRGCLTLAFCAFIIPRFVAFVKHFFIFFGGNGGACPSKSRVRTELHRLTAFPKSLAVPIPLAFVPLLYYNLGGLPSLIVF